MNRSKIRNLLDQRGSWYSIKALASGVEVFIYDEISFFGVTADQFVHDIQAIDASDITVRINSPGGDVFDGIAIYNALRQHPARVTTQVDSLAASIASVIAQAGDKRVVMSRGQMMIHEAAGVMMGNAEEMAKFSDILDKQSQLIAEIYAERGSKTADEFRALMRAETWLSDAEVVDLGLADEVVIPPTRSESATVDDDLTQPAPTARWLDLMAKAGIRSLEAYL